MSGTFEPSDTRCDGRPETLGRKRARILFVDDDERILRALQSMFRLEYDVRTTTNGRLVEDMLRREHFHVIVSDQRMPELQGIEVLRTAREVSPCTTRLLLTGFADLAAIVGSVNEGEIFRYISKPWDNVELSEFIASAANAGVALNSAQSNSEAVASTLLSTSSSEEPINLLYVDRHGELKRACRAELIAGLHTVWAAAPEEALDLMEKQTISIVVAAVDGDDKANLDFLNVLKVRHPHIVSMVVASAADSAMLIKLIHSVRIFRVIFRPIKPATCQLYFNAAVKRATNFRNAPALLITQQASASPSAAPLLESIGRRLQSIKSFFGSR